MAEAPLTLTVPEVRHRGISLSERRLLLFGLDGIAVALAFVLAFNLRTAEVRNAGFYVPRLGTVIVLALWVVSATIVDVWNVRAAASLRQTVSRVSAAVGFSLVGLLLVFLAVPYRITRPTLLLWAPLAWTLVMGERLLYRSLVAASSPPSRIALVADREAVMRVWPEVKDHVRGLYSVAAVVNPRKVDCTERLYDIVQHRNVGEVVLGLRDDIDRSLFRGILACHDVGIRIRSLADLYEELTGRLLLDQLGHSWLLGLPMRNDTSHVYAAVKRTLDVLVAAAAAAVLGLLIVPLGLLIKLDGGPLFHRQTRVGQHGRQFTVVKLRTMRHRPGQPTSWTHAGDSRVTMVGRVLRPLHLDELPQCWAILRGHMSLIGPRPEQPQYVQQLRSEIDFYNTRMTVRPGLTGWAQVNCGYGSSVADARMKLSYDLYYVKHQSLSLDLIILARTVMAVVSLSGR
ncbi:MAG TPA: exopolysaccharide biosynthesis polyprenyl glycosylphosphotransferase [Candidatus Binatia bacterium]|nr:exopolysaccharide biosynthesis polyprenyl glycosylphosphotransferase [Candidatus Binatia bacterium]